MKFVWPPLETAMENRKNKIIEGLESANLAKKELEIARQKAKEIINTAKIQATGIIDQANSHAITIEERAKESAHQSAKKIIKAADEENKAKINIIKQDLRNEVISIAIQGTEKLIKKNIDKIADRKILEEVAAQLQ
jgi:F-type H+-transporting ATPase subunit b